MMALKRLAIVLVVVAACAPAKEGGVSGDGAKKEKDPPPVWQERVVPGPGVVLRLKRAEGKFLVYEGSLDRSQQANNSYSEQGSFYLTVLCAGQEKGLDKLAIRRTYLDRKRTEILESKKKIDRVLENTDDLVNLGPNFDMVANMRCYAFDAQNNAAYRTDQILVTKDGRQLRGSVFSEEPDKIVFLTGEDKFELPRDRVVSITGIPQPHICLNDTPHYLFPIFSARAVAPGDTWKFRVPLIIPIEQGVPPRVLPTQFNASVTGRLREVREQAGSRIAVVDYQVSGAFESEGADFRDRFPAEFHDSNQVAHRLNGSGVVTVDVEKGRILEKSETFSIVLYGLSLVAQGADKPAKRDENRAEITSRFQIKLLPPGSKLRNGKPVPEY